ncbi:MAG: radical SAM protein [Candidatus Omnitrophica bacterium]|nr:radical SAM protein [Candidatus Omnitrophota bacterium]
MRTENYKDFRLNIHDKLSKRTPLVGQFELTHRCNVRCRHCYIPHDSKVGEITSAQWYRIFDEVHEQGCLWVCLTGGEPLIRKDFQDIYAYAYKKGFFIVLYTNGTLLDRETAKYLSKSPPFYVGMTVNSVRKETYESINQTPGSFQKAMASIDLMREYDIPFKLRVNLMTLNIDELGEMREFFEKIKAEYSLTTLIEPRIDGSTEPCSYRLPAKKVVELREMDNTVKENEPEEAFTKKIAGYTKDADLGRGGDASFRCPGGQWQFYVNPSGKLFFCNMVREPSWDILAGLFNAGFYEGFEEIKGREFRTDSDCRRCDLLPVCARCPGRAMLECGDPGSRIDYYCSLSSLQTIGKIKK